MYREWWYKCISLQLYNCGGVGGVDQQDAPPFPLRGGAYDHRGLRTSSSPHIHHHHHHHNLGICQELVALKNQAKSFLTPNPNIEVVGCARYLRWPRWLLLPGSRNRFSLCVGLICSPRSSNSKHKHKYKYKYKF